MYFNTRLYSTLCLPGFYLDLVSTSDNHTRTGSCIGACSGLQNQSGRRQVGVQSVSIRSPPPPSSRAAWSCNARKNGSTPVPASSGSPSVRTRPPSKPVRSAMSRFLTAARNCGDCTICSSVSTLGGLGRSGGRCGKSDCTSSGCDTKSGRRFAGVRTSVSEISGSGSAAGAPPPPPPRAPSDETS